MSPLAFVLALAAAAPGPKEAPKKELPSLVGEWTLTQVLHGGKPDNPPAGSTITFAADGKFLVKEGAQKAREEGTYTVDSKKEPAEIAIIPPESGVKKNPAIGIFKFEKDVLILCLSMGRTAEEVCIAGGIRDHADHPSAGKKRLMTHRRFPCSRAC